MFGGPRVVIFMTPNVGFFQEVADSIASHTKVVGSPRDATLALVLKTRPTGTIKWLLDTYPRLKVLTTMIPHHFQDNRVFFLNSRARDLAVNRFANYLWDIRGMVTHIDIKMGYGSSINTRTEAMEALSVIDLLTTFNINDLKVRFNFNKNGLHMSCRTHNLTASCFITNRATSFFEEITVFTTDGGRYTLDRGDMGEHTYGERFGAAWQTIVHETLQGDRYHQSNIGSMILKVKGASTRPP